VKVDSTGGHVNRESQDGSHGQQEDAYSEAHGCYLLTSLSAPSQILVSDLIADVDNKAITYDPKRVN
jgi:hypothetical protein